MKTDVKSAIADILKREGVEYVFGYTGGHIMQMWEAANNAGIKLVLNKQEGNAVYMADAFARIKNKPSVILGTAGPGVTNMTTGLATALLDSVPLVAIGANVATSAFGRNAVQDGSGRGRATEQRLALKAVTKKAMLSPSPEAVPDMVRDAFREALSGRRGPVYVEIPSDFWDREIEYEPVDPHRYKNTGIPSCTPEEVNVIYDKLHAAKHPLIIVGEGSLESGITPRMVKFLETMGIPFAVSPLGKNAVDEHHPLYLGLMRMEGKTQKTYEYIKKTDFVLFLGDRMQEWEVAWYDKNLFSKAKLAQIDSDWQEIGRVYPVDFSSVGSITSFILSERAKKHRLSDALQREVATLWKKYPLQPVLPDGNGINPLNLVTIVQKAMDQKATAVCDTGYAKSMAIVKLLTSPAQRFLTADKNGPMGYAVPASIGAALATGGEVICFVGDGGFQMSCNELGTAMNYGLKVIFVVQNNGGCASIVDYHTSVYGHHCADTFKNPDFATIAKAYGMKGFTAKTTAEFKKAFLEAKKSKTSVIIEAVVDQSTMIWE